MYRWEKEIGWEGEKKYQRKDKKGLAEWEEDLKYLEYRLSYLQNSSKNSISKLQKEIEELKRGHLTKEIRKEIAWKENILNSRKNMDALSEKKLEKQIREIKERIRLFKSNKNPSHKGFRHKIKKRKNSWVHDEVLKIIQSENPSYLMKEDVARRLEVSESQVEQVFRQLNLEGILHQPEHLAMHDSQRDPHGFDGNMAWMGDIYRIRNKNDEN